MNKILKLALVLFAVSAIVAGVLGVVNELTSPMLPGMAPKKLCARVKGRALSP